MANQSLEELDTKLVELEAKLPKLDSIKNPFWKTTTQCQTLLSEEPATAKPVKLTTAAKRFTPKGLFYIDFINFFGNTQRLASGITLVIKPTGEKQQTYKLTNSSDSSFAFVFIRKFCEWFEIYSTPPHPKTVLTRISIYGCDAAQLTKYAADIKYVIETKDDFSEFKEEIKQEYTETALKISELRTEHVDLTSKITTSTEELVGLDSKIKSSKPLIEQQEEKLKQIKLEAANAEEKSTNAKNNVTQLTATVDGLNKKISDLNSELEKLTTDKNLISDEYGPYVKEGKSQAAIYVGIVTLPLSAIIFSVYQLYAGAMKLLATDHSSLTDIAGSFLLRIPFAAVFGVAIYYSWRLTSSIIQKIFTIHGDRLTLAKLLVLAREAVHSSNKTLNAPIEIVLQEQIKLKVEVLKGHLSKDLGEKFDYNPQTEENKNLTKSRTSEAINDSQSIPEAEAHKQI